MAKATVVGARFRCKTHGLIASMDAAEYTKWARVGAMPIGCISCKRIIREPMAIFGRFSSRPCDARCMGAVRDNCDCSCGGVNHGIAS